MIPIIKGRPRAIKTLVTAGFQRLADEVFPALTLIGWRRKEGMFYQLGFFVSPRLALCLSRNEWEGEPLTVLSPKGQVWCAKSVRYDTASRLTLVELDQLEPSSPHHLPVVSGDFVSWRTPVLAVGGTFGRRSAIPIAMPGMVEGFHTLPAQPLRMPSGLFLDKMAPPRTVLRCCAMRVLDDWWGTPVIHGGTGDVVSIAASGSKRTPNVVMGPTPADMRRLIYG